MNIHQITAMVSNFSTSYNVVSISLVLPILASVCPDGAITETDTALVASSLLGGMIAGQLVGGALGDSCLGRMGALRLVMALQIAASLASAVVYVGVDEDEDNVDAGVGVDDTPVANAYAGVWWNLAVRRFWLGIGCGGVYPLAAVISAEDHSNDCHSNSNSNPNSNSNSNSSSSSSSVRRVVWTFGTQGVGFATVPLAAVVLLAVTSDLNVVWRTLLGLGAVPGVVLVGLQCLEWCRQREEVGTDGDGNGGGAPEREREHDFVPTVGDDDDDDDDDNGGEEETPIPGRGRWLQTLLHEPGLGRKVLGTAGTWFLFDVVFYGNTIFQPIVVAAAFGTTSHNHNDDDDNDADADIAVLRKTAVDSLLLACIALPGYAVSGLAIGTKKKSKGCLTLLPAQTPRYVMLQGFAAMAVLYAIIGANWTHLKGDHPVVLLALYGGTFFFANYGPNTTTFVLPSLVFRPEHRSTWNGVSAACGKLGALVGATLFAPAADELGDEAVMKLCAGVALVAWWLTYLAVVPEEEEGGENDEENDEIDDNGDEDEPGDEASAGVATPAAFDDEGVVPV
eukprot:jgi/Psemu1/203400/e_gw1.321.59.1